jgi:hypothetical protein
MVSCPSCGAEVPGGFAFCGRCGAPLTTGSRVEERRVVTVLFCDLAGFTARADQADPEDVRALLRPYHARLRHEIERFGGTVDKFIGDGVMGVFGVPSAHEDDPERAVRCALAVLEAAEELELTERFLAGADAPAARYRHCLATARAVLAETKGDLEVALAGYSAAADGWGEFGVVLEQGQALLGVGRCAARLGDGAAARGPLGEARAIFDRLGATALQAETDRLFAHTAT